MVVKSVPTGTQLITHSVSGRYVTPEGNHDLDLQVRLWRAAPVTAVKTAMWEIIPQASEGNHHLVRIKNAGYNRCLTLKEVKQRAPVMFAERDDDDDNQLWLIIHADPAQADFLIASPKKPNLVMAPREGAQDLETLLEMEEQGPWTDQFWRWRVPRT